MWYTLLAILKEISPGISLEGMMLKLKLQYFGHIMWRVNSFLDFDAGRDWEQENKGTTEDEMAGWHRLDGRESGWTPGAGDGQGGLACCDSRGRKELDMTERSNWTELRGFPICSTEVASLYANTHFLAYCIFLFKTQNTLVITCV